MRPVVLILALAVISDAAAGAMELPIPGATIGLLVLFGVFVARGGIEPPTARLFDATVPHLPLLFVAPAVGVIANVDILANAWVQVVSAIALGTTLTIAVTGRLAQLVLRASTEKVPA